MKRRTRHMLILIGVPLLLTLAVAGWIADAARKHLTLHRAKANWHSRPAPATAARQPRR
jgi:hypothetical protein